MEMKGFYGKTDSDSETRRNSLSVGYLNFISRALTHEIQALAFDMHFCQFFAVFSK